MPEQDIITQPQPENGNVIKYRLSIIESDFRELRSRYESRHELLEKHFEEKLNEQNETIHAQAKEITALKERLTAMQLFQAGFTTIAGIIATVVAKLIGS